MFALLSLACGPPQLASDGDTSEADAEEESSGESSSTTSSMTTSSDETTSDETSTTQPSTTLPGFVPEYDVMGCECDPFAQDCPDGEKCVPYASTGGYWDADKCVPVLGDQAPGEPCIYAGTIESTDDCDATSFCWDVVDVNGEAVGICTPFCTGTADDPECPEGFSCLLANEGSINVCISICDPILQDCVEGFACYWADYGFNCILTTLDLPPGEPCGHINDCAAGSGCITAEVLPSCAGAACCSPFCQVGAGDLPCEVVPGTTCVPFFEQGLAPPGYEQVGVCLVPP
jgi:hypothetical protein